MDVVAGVTALRPEHGPIFTVIGVFDGLHRGHAYLLDHLVQEARTRDARPCVITFDHHPDEVLTGSAPPLLLDPDERIERLAAAGVEVTVVQPFDDVVRQTSYDDFVDLIRKDTEFRGLVMTPDAAFGYRAAGDTRGAPGARRAPRLRRRRHRSAGDRRRSRPQHRDPRGHRTWRPGRRRAATRPAGGPSRSVARRSDELRLADGAATGRRVPLPARRSRRHRDGHG